MTRFALILLEKLLEIFLRCRLGETRSLGVEGYHFSAAVDQHEEIEAGDFPDCFRSILDRYRIWTGHNRARDGKIRQKSHVTSQHLLAFVTEILECAYRIPQIDRYALPYVLLNTATNQKQANGGQAGRDDQHGQQEAGAQAQARQKLRRRRGRITVSGFRRRVHADQRTNLYPMPCTVRKWIGLEGSFSSF